MKCTIFLPEGVDAPTRQFLANLGAEVRVAGTVYSEAVVAARQAVQREPKAFVFLRRYLVHRELRHVPEQCPGSSVRTSDRMGGPLVYGR